LKKILTLPLIFVMFLSAFSLPTFQVRAETNVSLAGLYAGTTNPGVVWRYKGDVNWESITTNPSELGWSITGLIVYEDKLFASAITNPDVYSSEGRIYRYEGDGVWRLIASLDNQVTFLIVYKGNLYAGTVSFVYEEETPAPATAKLYKYDSITESFSKVLEYKPWFGFRSAYVWGDWLYLGEWYWDRFARWNGENLEEFQPEYWGSCIYSFEEYGDYLYAGAYGGTIYKVTYEPPITTQIWKPPHWQYAWTLKSFKNKLYIGLDAGETGFASLYKYDGNLEKVYEDPVWSYATTTSNPHEGIISMVSDEISPIVPHQPYLYIGVGGQAVGYPTYLSAEGVGRVYRYDGVNPPVLISGNLGAGVQVLYYVPPLSLKLKSLGEFNLTFYYCVYNSEVEGTQTYTMTLPDKRPGHEGEEITLTLKASFWFGGEGVAMQGTGRTEANGFYIKYEYDSGGGWVKIGSSEWNRVVKKRYNDLGITDFTGFRGLALRFPQYAKYYIVDSVRGAAQRQLVPWYSIAAPRSIPLGTRGCIKFTTGETLTPPITSSGRTWMLFIVDDRGGSIKERRVDIYLGEGSEAKSQWYQTGGNRKGLVFIYVP
jgi:3D (Asp-Asp-Asp) domain-containing protein